MNFNDYQKQSKKTAIYPKFGGQGWIYPALGLPSEAGEVTNKLKKVIRDGNGEISDETKQAVKAELGDVLWYVAQLSTELGFSLDDVAQSNLDKLFDRKTRNVLKGKGDNR